MLCMFYLKGARRRGNVPGNVYNFLFDLDHLLGLTVFSSVWIWYWSRHLSARDCERRSHGKGKPDRGLVYFAVDEIRNVVQTNGSSDACLLPLSVAVVGRVNAASGSLSYTWFMLIPYVACIQSVCAFSEKVIASYKVRRNESLLGHRQGNNSQFIRSL